MLHARKDYDPIQDPRPNGIGEDEPVMLFRAKDRLAPALLSVYVLLLEIEGCDDYMIATVEGHAKAMRRWQRENLSKRPDIPPGSGRYPEDT